MTLTPEETESLRIAIAEECGWHERTEPRDSFNIKTWWQHNDRYPSNVMPVPPYTTSIDAIQKAAMEKFKDGALDFLFSVELSSRRAEIKISQNWILTALDWSIAFARTAKIWRWKV